MTRIGAPAPALGPSRIRSQAGSAAKLRRGVYRDPPRERAGHGEWKRSPRSAGSRPGCPRIAESGTDLASCREPAIEPAPRTIPSARFLAMRFQPGDRPSSAKRRSTREGSATVRAEFRWSSLPASGRMGYDPLVSTSRSTWPAGRICRSCWPVPRSWHRPSLELLRLPDRHLAAAADRHRIEHRSAVAVDTAQRDLDLQHVAVRHADPVERVREREGRLRGRLRPEVHVRGRGEAAEVPGGLHAEAERRARGNDALAMPAPETPASGDSHVSSSGS